MAGGRRLALVIALALGAEACRQADGPIPTPTEGQRNEIGDMAHDLINVANKDPQGPGDLAQDIAKYAPSDDVAEKSRELARRLTTVLSGTRLDDQSSQRLAHSLWIGVTAREISQRQAITLQEDVKAILAAANVPAGSAQAVADQLGEVQTSITANPKRWYQVF